MLATNFRVVTFLVATLLPPFLAFGQQAADSEISEALSAARTLLEQEQLEAAEAAFAGVLELEESSAAFLGRGQAIFWGEGREAQALPDFQRALELDPTSLDALIERYTVHDWLNKNWVGRRELLDHVEAQEFEAPAMVELCDWSSSTGDRELTDRLLELGFERHGDLTPFLALRGLQAYHIDENEAARRDLELAAQRPDVEPWAIATLAECQLFGGDLSEALKTAERAVELGGESGTAYFVRGRVQYQLGEKDKAAADLARAGQLEPFYRAWSYADDPDFDASIVQEFGGALLVVLGLVMGLGLLGLMVGGLAEGRREAAARPAGTQPRYDGPWSDLFGIYLQNVALTVLTLGIYRFWAKVRTRRFHYQHTSFAAGFPPETAVTPDSVEGSDEAGLDQQLIEGRFDYHATGTEKFVGFLKGLLILAPLVGGLWWWRGWLSSRQDPEIASVAVAYGFMFSIYLLRPLILVGSQRFNLSRTSWNSLRWRFTGKVWDAYKLYLRDSALMLVTFGIYWSWHAVRVRDFRLRNSKLGDAGFEFHGTGSELFKINFFGTMVTYITLGIYSPWFYAKRRNFFVEETRFMGKRWKSDLTGRQVLGVGGTGALVTFLTLGFGLPWAITRWRRMLAHSTYYRARVPGDELASIEGVAASSSIEGLGEAGELLGEIGDLFGL